MPAERSIATLGGPTTFAGQALSAYLHDAPDAAEIRYLPTVGDLWAALDEGAVDGLMLASATEHTGWSPTAQRLLSRPGAYAVLGEAIVPYRCVLVGTAGTRVDQLREVRGHGSVRECQAYFARQTPRAALSIHKGNSSAALADVERAGDPTVAVVTTRAALSTTTLRVLAEDIDGGARGVWWLIGRAPFDAPAAAGTLVAVAPTGSLPAVVALTTARGFRLRDLMSVPGDGLFRSRHLLVADHMAGGQSVSAMDVAAAGGELIGAFGSSL